MEKDKGGNKCCGTCAPQGCAGGSCYYGGSGKHSMLRLLVVLLVMMLIFYLGMQIGELKAELSSNRGYHELRYKKGYSYDDMPMMKQAPVEAPVTDTE